MRGGHLRIEAVFPDARITIRTFADIEHAATTRTCSPIARRSAGSFVAASTTEMPPATAHL